MDTRFCASFKSSPIKWVPLSPTTETYFSHTFPTVNANLCVLEVFLRVENSNTLFYAHTLSLSLSLSLTLLSCVLCLTNPLLCTRVFGFRSDTDRERKPISLIYREICEGIRRQSVWDAERERESESIVLYILFCSPVCLMGGFCL